MKKKPSHCFQDFANGVIRLNARFPFGKKRIGASLFFNHVCGIEECIKKHYIWSEGGTLKDYYSVFHPHGLSLKMTSAAFLFRPHGTGWSQFLLTKRFLVDTMPENSKAIPENSWKLKLWLKRASIVTGTWSHAANFFEIFMIDVMRNSVWWICTKKGEASEAVFTGWCWKFVSLAMVFHHNRKSFQKTF